MGKVGLAGSLLGSRMAMPSNLWLSAPTAACFVQGPGTAIASAGLQGLESPLATRLLLFPTPQGWGLLTGPGGSGGVGSRQRRRVGWALGHAGCWANAWALRELCAGIRGQWGHGAAAVPETSERPLDQGSCRALSCQAGSGQAEAWSLRRRVGLGGGS